MPKDIWFYTILGTRTNYGFRHLHIDFYEEQCTSSMFTLTWQVETPQNKPDEDRYWYGFRISNASPRSNDALNRMTRLLRRILPRDENWFSLAPAALLETCENKGIHRRVMEGRYNNKWITIDEVPDPMLHKWVAIDASNGRPIVDTLALDEQDAVAQLLQTMTAWVNDYEWSKEKRRTTLAGWLNNSCPVENWTAAGHAMPASWEPIEDILAV